MTAPTLVPDATRCPDCQADLADRGDATACPACGLRLTGPEATRLWQVDVELLGLERSRRLLVAERAALLQVLRTGTRAPQPLDAWPAAPPAEWTPQRVQNLLLALGGLLLAGAALVFAAVTYERLGASGRAAVLATLTLVAAVAAPRLRRRGLTSTAETVGAVVLALAALDAYGLRTLGLAADSGAAAYAAGSAAVLAAAGGAYGRLTGLRAVQVLAVLAAQLPVPLLLVHVEATAAAAGLALAALAGVDVAALALRDRLDRAVRTAVLASTAVVTSAAVGLALVSSAGAEEPGLAAAALLACAAVLAGAGRLTGAPARALLWGAAVVLLGGAVDALLRGELAPTAAALAALALLVALAATRLPRQDRTGPVVGALLVAGSAVLDLAAPVQAVLRPLEWPGAAWTLADDSTLRSALAPGDVWTGPGVTPFVVLAAAATALVTGWALDRLRLALLPAGALALAGVVLVPLALDLPYAAGLAVLLVVAGAMAAGAAALLGRDEAVPLAAGGLVLALHACAWAAASQTATLVVLPLVALGCAAFAVPRQPRPVVPVALAGLLASLHIGALGVASDLADDQVGGLLLVAVAGALLAAALLDGDRAPGAEAAAVVAACAALALASSDVGWLSWVLAALGLLALATALRPDRRACAVLGGLLLSASSWVRLADAGVTSPEPYVLPLAAAALVLGAVRRRAEPATGSWAAYGPGLVLALVPSLLAGITGDELTRPLLVGLAALALLLAGARSRLQAPLAVGAGVVVVVALDLVGPYAAALPRWLSLGGAGALLLVVGATYEQRRRDVARLRGSFDALA